MSFLATPNKMILTGLCGASSVFALVTFITSCVFVSSDGITIQNPGLLGVDGRHGFLFIVFSLINLAYWSYHTFVSFKFKYDLEKHTYIKTSAAYMCLMIWFNQMSMAGIWYHGASAFDSSQVTWRGSMLSSVNASIAFYSFNLVCGLAYIFFLHIWKHQLIAEQQTAPQPFVPGGQQDTNIPPHESAYYAAPTQQPNYENQGPYQAYNQPHNDTVYQ